MRGLLWMLVFASQAFAEDPAEAVYKNIQVLKGVPSSQLLPVMHFMRSSLGVRCEFCHIAENGKYQLDEKPAKGRAREMLRLTRQINDANFGGKNVVTCNTCHHGSVATASVPGIAPDESPRA